MKLNARLATRSAVALYLLAAMILAVTATIRGPFDTSNWAIPGALASAAIALLLQIVFRNRPAQPAALTLAQLGGLLLVAGLVAATGGETSPYQPLLFLPMVHAAVFGTRAQAVVAALLGSVLFLAPVAYDADAGVAFTTLALVTLPPVLLTVAVIHVAVDALREERRRLAVREADALHLADSDPLTGAGNYRVFWRALEQEASRARRHGGSFAVITLDLDGFKAINDEMGHQAGDDVLRRVAHALQQDLRHEDVLCRQGGDEFAVIATGAGDDREARHLARRLERIAGRAGRQAIGRTVTATSGWAVFGSFDETAEALFARADRELYNQKRTARPELDVAETPGRPAEVAPLRPEAALPADERLAALSACARALALAPDERTVAKLAAVHVDDALDVETVEMWQMRPGRRHLSVTGRAYSKSSVRAPLGDVSSEIAKAASHNHVIKVDAPHGLLSLLVPVSHGEDVFGVLALHAIGPRLQETEARHLALALAAQVGRGISAVRARHNLTGSEQAEVSRFAAVLSGSDAGEDVAELAVSTGRELGLGSLELGDVRMGALLHNIGMVGIPAGLPLRPAALSPAERQVVQQHPLIAEQIVAGIPGLAEAGPVIRHAYERVDGSGYPDGLAGAQIPLVSRVVHAAVTMVAMTSPRPYRKAAEREEAITELRNVSGTQLDPKVVSALLTAIDGFKAQPARLRLAPPA